MFGKKVGTAPKRPPGCMVWLPRYDKWYFQGWCRASSLIIIGVVFAMTSCYRHPNHQRTCRKRRVWYEHPSSRGVHTFLRMGEWGGGAFVDGLTVEEKSQ